MPWIILAFLIVPALEIAVFIWVGGKIGPWWVALLILLTGVVGVALAKQQGTETLQRARQSIHRRIPPTEEILDGICIIVGGILLFTPGFITDVLGFLLIIPWTRKPFKTLVRLYIMKKIAKGRGKIVYRDW